MLTFLLALCCLLAGLYFKLHGQARPVTMKKTVIKRRKRVPAATQAAAMQAQQQQQQLLQQQAIKSEAPAKDDDSMQQDAAEALISVSRSQSSQPYRAGGSGASGSGQQQHPLPLPNHLGGGRGRKRKSTALHSAEVSGAETDEMADGESQSGSEAPSPRSRPPPGQQQQQAGGSHQQLPSLGSSAFGGPFGGPRHGPHAAAHTQHQQALADAQRNGKAGFELPPLMSGQQAYSSPGAYWEAGANGGGGHNGGPYGGHPHHLQQMRANSPFTSTSNGGGAPEAGSPGPYGRLPPPASLLQQPQSQQQRAGPSSASGGSAPAQLAHLTQPQPQQGVPMGAAELEQWRADLLVGKDWLEGMLLRTGNGLKMVDEQIKRLQASHAPQAPAPTPAAATTPALAATATTAPSTASTTPAASGSPAPASESGKAVPLKRNSSSSGGSKKIWTVETISHGSLGTSSLGTAGSSSTR
jgi:GATA-binding protein